MLFKPLAVAGLGVLRVKALGPPSADLWHINCDDPGHCEYRHASDPIEHGTLHSRADIIRPAQAVLPPDFQNTLDLNQVDTRCSLTSSGLVEKFTRPANQWVPHHQCPSGTSCIDLFGHGACKSSDSQFTFPGLKSLWPFNCPNGTASCRLANSQAPKPQEPYLTGTTRCSPNGQTVQYFNSTNWIDVYLCQPGAKCIESGGRGACQAGKSLVYPLRPRSEAPSFVEERGPQDQPPTRCNPNTMGTVQFYSDYYQKWIDFHACEFNIGGCFNEDGKAHCNDANQVMVPVVELPNGATGPHALTDLNGNLVAPPKTATSTRCAPSDPNQKRVEYLLAGQWLPFYNCLGVCQTMSGYAACEEHRNKYVIPSPPSSYNHRVAARSAPAPSTLESITAKQITRCDRFSPSGVQKFQRGIMVAFGNCPGNLPCREVNGSAVCDVDGRSYSMRGNGVTESRGDPLNPNAPDFHTFDTRCNPQDSSEILRHDGKSWVHHYTCTFTGSCIDVDGHGSCRLLGNIFELPSANLASIQMGEPVNPLRIKTKCNKSNATEVLQWNGNDWKPSAVCLPPHHCYDFGGESDFAVCVHSQAKRGEVWMPWPSLGRGTNNGLVTRCKSNEFLEQFKDNSWVPFRRCQGAFTCQQLPSGNGGCSAPSLHTLITQAGSNRLPKREDPDSLFEDSQDLTEQGKNLINQGEDLMAQSDSLLQGFFGSGNGVSIDEFDGMYGYADMEMGSDKYKSGYDKKTDKDEEEDADKHEGDKGHEKGNWDKEEADEEEHEPSTKAKGPTGANPALIPTASSKDNPPIHRRASDGSNGLVDYTFQLHKQGEHLVIEGNRLVQQGRQLLEQIFGDKADEFIKNITGKYPDNVSVVTGYPITVTVPNPTASTSVSSTMTVASTSTVSVSIPTVSVPSSTTLVSTSTDSVPVPTISVSSSTTVVLGSTITVPISTTSLVLSSTVSVPAPTSRDHEAMMAEGMKELLAQDSEEDSQFEG